MAQRGISALTFLLMFLVFTLGFAIRPAFAQDQKPVFCIHGGDWEIG
jgi:hypothetical protein